MGGSSSVTQQSAAKGFAVLTISMVLVKVLSLLYVPILRIILGDASLGIYYAAYQVFAYVYIIANAGLPVAISKLVSELIALGNYKDAVKTFKIARTILIGFGAIISILMFIFASQLSVVLNSAKSSLAIRALAPTVLITTVLCSYKGYFQGRGNMTPTAISQVAEQIFNIIFSLAFAYLLISYGDEYGAAGGTVGTTIGAFVAASFLIYVYGKNRKYNVPKNVAESSAKRLSTEAITKMILAYAIPMTIGVALQNAGMLVDLKIVKARLLYSGFDTNEVDILWSILSQYNTLISVPMALISSLAISILPVVSRNNAIEDKKALKNNINSTYRVTYIIAAPCAAGLAILSVPILRLIGYNVEAARLFVYGSVVLVLTATSLVQSSILQGLGKVKQITLYSVFGLLGKIIINYLFVAVTSINILGAIIGNGVSYLIMVTFNQILINKTLKFRIKLIKISIKPVIASIVMAISTYLTYSIVSFVLSFMIGGYILNAMSTLMSIGIAVLTYFLVLFQIGGVRKADLSSLPNKLVKLIPNKLIIKLK